MTAVVGYIKLLLLELTFEMPTYYFFTFYEFILVKICSVSLKLCSTYVFCSPFDLATLNQTTDFAHKLEYVFCLWPIFVYYVN